MRNSERKKILLFGSEHCADCGPAKEVLAEKGVKYTYIDITADMARLKMFINLRDKSPAFDKAKAKELVGIPCLQVDNKEYLIRDAEYLSRLVDELELVW